MIVDTDNYRTDATFTQNTIFNGITGKNIYVSPGVVLILEGICGGNVYLNKNSYCEIDGIVDGDFIYGEGTFDYFGVVEGEIRKS
jgi:hypothetical protein